MGFLLFIVAIIVFGGFLLIFNDVKKCTNELDSLRQGLFGDFNVSAIDDRQHCALAFDRERKKLAFVRVQVPIYNNENSVKGHVDKTVICSYDDVASILLIENNDTKSLVTAQFRFHSEIPRGNLWKQLHYIGGSDQLSVLLKAELPFIPMSTTVQKF